MFVKLQRPVDQSYDWYAHMLQFELKYWQRSSVRKMIIEGNLHLTQFAPLHDYYSDGYLASDGYDVIDVSSTEGLRGRQYDLRMTFIPVDWMAVLNTFNLDTSTYIILYIVIDALMIMVVMMLWGFFRGTTRLLSPPKLHFKEWFKNFELNPVTSPL